MRSSSDRRCTICLMEARAAFHQGDEERGDHRLLGYSRWNIRMRQALYPTNPKTRFSTNLAAGSAAPLSTAAAPALPLKELLGAEGDVHRALRDDPGGNVDAHRHARERHRNAAQTESAAQDWPFVVEAGDRPAAPSDVAAVGERRQLADKGHHQQRLPTHVAAPPGVK